MNTLRPKQWWWESLFSSFLSIWPICFALCLVQMQRQCYWQLLGRLDPVLVHRGIDIFSKTGVILGPGEIPSDDINLLRLDETIIQIMLSASKWFYGTSFKEQYRSYEYATAVCEKEAYMSSYSKITEIFVCPEGIKAQVIQYFKFSSSSAVITGGGSMTRFSRPCQTMHIPVDKELVGIYGQEGGAINELGFSLKPVICRRA